MPTAIAKAMEGKNVKTEEVSDYLKTGEKS